MLRRYSGYTAQQIFQEIKSQGYPGGYTLVKEYLRKVRPKAREAYLSLHFKPGQSAQVDWGVAGYIFFQRPRNSGLNATSDLLSISVVFQLKL